MPDVKFVPISNVNTLLELHKLIRIERLSALILLIADISVRSCGNEHQCLSNEISDQSLRVSGLLIRLPELWGTDTSCTVSDEVHRVHY